MPHCFLLLDLSHGLLVKIKKKINKICFITFFAFLFSSTIFAFTTWSVHAGTNSSTTELYLTGALPSTTTFPSPASLSSFQHTGAYPSRSYTSSNTSLTLSDPTFPTSTNGLFSHHDPLLHLKPSQAVLPVALAFSHLSGPSVGSALPVQSSTYRSAQESAPHLLQPQYNLLPSALPSSHGAPQPYGATVFSNSIERALQRECSVIKHHQRPSSSHIASEELPNSEHSLQGYYGTGSDTDVSYQEEPSQSTPVSCSPSSRADSTQVVSGSSQSKTDCAPQSDSSALLLKGKDCSSNRASHPAENEESRSQNLRTRSPELYSSSAQKLSSVVASQQSVQLSNLMSSTLSQTYITPHTQSQTSHSPAEKLPLYTTLPSLSSHSDNVAPVSQTFVYLSTPGLSQEQGVQYGAEVHNLGQETFTESYTTSHSQGASNLTFSSHSQEQDSVTLSQSYNTGQQSLSSLYSSDCVQSLPSNSTVDYSHVQDSLAGKTHPSLSHQQTQIQNVSSVSLPTFSSPAQSLQNAIRSSVQDIKPIYAKQKLEELHLQDIEALRQVSMITVADNSMASHNNVIYVVSKMDNHKPQSVIRSNSRSDEQFMGHSHIGSAQVKNEQMGSVSQQQIGLNSGSGHEVDNTKSANSAIVPLHGPLCSEQLKQPPVQLRSPESHQQNQQTINQSPSQIPAAHSQFISLPNSQVLLEPNQMILVQQPLVHSSENTSKLVPLQGIHSACLGSVNVQYLQMDGDLLGSSVNETQTQQATIMSEPNSECSSKHHYTQAAGHQPINTKNQFTLNSICFPDSMLLADDRNILSNVDDILAATVAACGVAPQDFVKASSSSEAEMAGITTPVDSKGHLQTVDIRQVSPSFSSGQHPIIDNTNSHTISMTLNQVQMAADCQGQPVHHNITTNFGTNGNGRNSENDYHSVRQAFDPSGVQNLIEGSAKCTETQKVPMKCPVTEGSPKKKVRSKSSTKPGASEDDVGVARSAKRSAQPKHQNSRGSDVSSPSAQQSASESCPQQERIRQKIREVEEKQPEVKTGLIGSFLDFIKSGPKQQNSQSPARTVNRPRKPSTSSKQCGLPALPPKVQMVPVRLLPQESLGASSQQKHLDEELRKNLETLPSFSSDEEENTGKNQALRNSISSALSALDENSDRRTRTGNGVRWYVGISNFKIK